MDGQDEGDLILIDEMGCPTDGTIMSALTKVKGTGKLIETKFEAFKFPSSDAVLFKAIVSPCVGTCQPAHCYISTDYGPGPSSSTGSMASGTPQRQVYSYGKRRKRSAKKIEANEEEVILSRFLRVEDKFPSDPELDDVLSNSSNSNSLDHGKNYQMMDSLNEPLNDQSCYGPTSIILTCVFFLFGQILIILFVTYMCVIRRTKTFKYGIRNHLNPYHLSQSSSSSSANSQTASSVSGSKSYRESVKQKRSSGADSHSSPPLSPTTPLGLLMTASGHHHHASCSSSAPSPFDPYYY